MTSGTQTIVVADANVLINLLHTARLCICADLPDLDFMIPDHVFREITWPDQRSRLVSALDSGALQPCSITHPEDMKLFTDLITHLGRGEAACLVLAERHGWTVDSDEKGRFRREARKRIGKHRLIGTPDLFVRAIHAGLITVAEADADKETLERNPIKMTFQSFRERIEAPTANRSERSTR